MKTVILCYHKIGSEADEGRFLNCDPLQLDKHARFFRQRGWAGFLPKEYDRTKSQGICFTFDDAYVSAVAHAPSILESSDYRGAFYVVPSLVGKSSIWDGERDRPLADWNALHDLASHGHEIGNHTYSHQALDHLDFAAQVEELSRASASMKDHGFQVDSLAFPYGNWNHNTLEAMKAVNIRVGLALGKRPVGSDPIECLPRIVVGYSDTVLKLLYKIYIRPKLP